MPQQTPAQTRVVDVILTNHVRGYRQQQLVGENLFPRVNVAQYGGRILRFGKESFKLYSTARAPGSATKRVTFGHESDPYSITPRALEAPVPRELMRDASQVPGIDLGTRAVNLVLRSTGLELEVDQATLAITAANYDNDHKVTLTGQDRWKGGTSSDPSADVETGREAIRASTGQYPNVAVVSATAMSALRTHENIIDRIKYTGRDIVTADLLAALWDIDKVVVGKAVRADAAGAFTDAWGDDVVLAYVPPGASTMEEPSYGYTYTIDGMPMVEQAYWDESCKSWIYGVSDDCTPVLTGITAGYLIKGAGLAP
jgi:hypothetical protein